MHKQFHQRRLLLFVSCALFGACVTGPVRPLPDPLPEILAWAGADQGQGAFLGLEVQENDSGSLEDLFFDPGFRVTVVVDNSPAASAGLRQGDIVLALGGQDVNDPGTLDALLHGADLGAPTRLRVRRGDAVFDLEVQLEERTAGTGAATLAWRADPARSRAGWLTGKGGVVLVSVDPMGPMMLAGLPIGSVVQSVDGTAVHSARALIRLLQSKAPGTEVELSAVVGDAEPKLYPVKLLDVPRRTLEAKIPFLIGYESDREGNSVSFYMLDFWLLWLVRYERSGKEETWSFLRFIRYSSGIGDLSE